MRPSGLVAPQKLGIALAEEGVAARIAAVRAVVRVLSGETLDAALTAVEAQVGERDRAFLRALAYGTVRQESRIAWQLSELSHRPLPARDKLTWALIGVGLFQLESMRVPDHAVVNTAVAAAKGLGRSRMAGFINAVLRRFQRERARLTDPKQQPPSARFAHPDWLIDAFRRDWPDDYEAILTANNAPPPLWLRVNRLRIDRETFAAQLESAGIKTVAAPNEAEALRVLDPLPVTEIPGFREGLFAAQDVAAQAVADWVNAKPNHRVLDACAAPGGKTAHLLERGASSDRLLALDADAERCASFEQNLQRLGHSADIRHADAAEPATWWDGEPFNRILLDAPCTATGVIRRHPDIKLLRRPQDVAAAVERQDRLLAALWPLVAQGGCLTYATCSLLKAENHDRIQTFLAGLAEKPAAFEERQRLVGEADADGFYYACLTKANG